MAHPLPGLHATYAADVGALCADLLRIDTTNAGDDAGPGEREAAEYVAGALEEAGISATLTEPKHRRTSVLARIPGKSTILPPLLIHGHLDTVPADPHEWSRHPLSGDLHQGQLWGRGAVDMKGTVAMTLSLVRAWAKSGQRPCRDLVLAFLADEESTGEHGARHVVAKHRDLLADVKEAVSESGGFSVTVRPKGAAADARVYPIAVGERGTAWMRLTASGTGGHGSGPGGDNAVADLVHALSRLAGHTWPVTLTPAVHTLLTALDEVLGIRIDRDRLQDEARRLGQLGELFDCTIRNTTNPTVLNAGCKVNVIPSHARAEVDGRFLPGTEDAFLDTVDRLLGPKVTREFINCEAAVAADHDGPAFAAMTEALRSQDPHARPVPFIQSGGTDAKSFAEIGISTYGFAPVLLDRHQHYYGMFHGVDERVPVAGLAFGVRVLHRFLTTY
ncbi:M20/M25/M40 family metallo-hydrolase [Streptomyces sp. JL2001]|uniref:M20/M25/M40 family metallo-hydrolase n=1 Tax=Streptomyces sp. JL2001 TaxID=3342488 RepID=UPI003D806C3C